MAELRRVIQCVKEQNFAHRTSMDDGIRQGHVRCADPVGPAKGHKPYKQLARDEDVFGTLYAMSISVIGYSIGHSVTL